MRRVTASIGTGAVLLALAALLSGCTFSETTPSLGIPTPGTFDFGKRKSAAPIGANWPGMFGSKELARLAASTAADSLDIAAAAARIVQAQAQAEQASAAQFPQLSGSTSGQRTFQPVTVQTKSLSEAKTLGLRTSANNVFQLGLTASYEVDFWGRNAYTSLAAEENVLVQRYARDTVALSSVATLVNDYFTLLSAQDRLRIAQDDVKAANEVLEAIKGRLTVGTVTQLEVAQQESVIAQEKALIPPLQLQVEQSRIAIALLMGRTPESVRVAGGSLDRLRAPRIPAGLPSQLLRRRPDIAEAEATLASNDATVQAARAAFFPTVTLTGNGGVESLVLKNLLRPEALFGTVAGSLTQPLFDGYALQGQLDLARAVRREDLEAYRKAIIQALVDVENALAAIRRDEEHEQRLTDVVKASQQAFDIERERLKLGTIDITTTLQTQLTLFGAQDAVAVARLTRFQAMASLAQALGGGFSLPPGGLPRVEPAITLPPPLSTGLPGQALVPPNEAATETHALPGQPPIPNGGTDAAPGLGKTSAVR